MKVTYRLESVNLKNNTGVLKHKNDSKGSKYETIDVSLGYELHKRIKKQWYRGLNEGDTFIKTTFTSRVDSPVFSENPFKLTKFRPINGSDIPVNWQLSLVFEETSILAEIETHYAEKFRRLESRRIKPHKWLRTEFANNTKMMVDTIKLRMVSGKHNWVNTFLEPNW